MGEISNRLIAALDPLDREYIAARLREVDLPPRKVLFEPADSVECIFFPRSASIAEFVLNGAGAPMAAITIGHAGVAGLGPCLSGGLCHTRQLVLMPGSALCLDRASLLEAAERSSSLRRLLLAYAEAFVAEVLQSAACLAAHSLEERLARYLLTYTDDCARTELPMVEEALSVVLGVRPSRLMLAGRTFQKLGLIEYGPDFFNVVNRAGLEDIACECYPEIRTRYRSALSPD
jgi:CRP-like cAMP-binding protein